MSAPEMKPRIGGDGVPRCSENECPAYDGKRCQLLGCRPSVICEPAVIDMADRLRSPGAAEMREALIEVAARARMNFITTDEAWADRHQPCPLTKIVTPIVDDWLKRHHLPAPGAADMRSMLVAVARKAIYANTTSTFPAWVDPEADRIVDEYLSEHPVEGMTSVTSTFLDPSGVPEKPLAIAAAEMREAAAKVCDQESAEWEDRDCSMVADACYECAAQIRALPLPAPEVPGEVRAWVASYDDEATAGAHHLAVDDALRDWIRKEYGI